MDWDAVEERNVMDILGMMLRQFYVRKLEKTSLALISKEILCQLSGMSGDYFCDVSCGFSGKGFAGVTLIWGAGIHAETEG